MPHAITTKTTLDDAEDDIIYTRAALKADPNAKQLLPLTDSWHAEVDVARAADKAARTEIAECDAERIVSNHHLDTECVKLADDLHLAVNKDHKAIRWVQFFAVAVGLFIRMALARQVAVVQGWLTTSTDPVLEAHRPMLTLWSDAAAAALVRTAGSSLVRGRAMLAREAMADRLTRERDGLHDALSALGRTLNMARTWPDTFFRVHHRAAKRVEADAGDGNPTPPVGGGAQGLASPEAEFGWTR